MNTTENVYNNTITISKEEYLNLLEYKRICKEISEKFSNEVL